MNCMDARTAKERHSLFSYALLILPSLLLGIVAMVSNGLSPMLWGQQAAAWMVFALLAQPLQRVIKRVPASVQCILLLLLLAASLMGEEVGGARRWLDLGVFQLNAAMLVIPMLLVSMERLNFPLGVMIATAAILSFQPDLSQFSAFSAAALTLLAAQRKKPLWLLGSALLLIVLAINCLRFPVALEPVTYCEGIITMLHETSPLLAAAGIVSLAAIPGWFLYKSIRTKQNHLLALAVYYAVSMLFVLSGNDPVPFMGFGLSPIAGYYLAFVCAPSPKA